MLRVERGVRGPRRLDVVVVGVGPGSSRLDQGTAGLRRTARLADGWLASAYNTTPAGFTDAWVALQGLLADEGRDGTASPNALATMWFHITDGSAEADRVLRARLVPVPGSL